MEFQGLTFEEAEKRLKEFGKNEIVEKKKVSTLQIFLSQFKSPIILLMIFAAVISLFINFLKSQDFLDSILIIAVILISAFAGFIQEYKAEKAVEALKKMAARKAKVIREGKIFEIDAKEIVPEDLIVVEGGDIIPADAEIIEGKVEVDESPLTGESRAVKKGKNEKIFSGCNVLVGKAIAKVFATGMKTEIGKIAEEMQEMEEEETPFQKELSSFTKNVVRITIAIILIAFLLNFRKFGILEAFMISIALAIAAIPEGLPAILTASLSLAAHKMVKRNALVRRLSIIESIGSVNVICTDKTGTITEGKMKVKDIWFLEESEKAKEIAINICYYCNDAKLVKIGNEEKLVGDETDVALKEFSSPLVKLQFDRIDEIHFTSERKMMSVLCENSNKKFVFSKGAPEVILEKCSKALVGEKIVDLIKEMKEEILKKNKELASQAYRVLALAYKEGELEEKDLIFVGLIYMADLPRKEVKQAIEECYSAGIRVIMITGDNENTALAVAKEIGLEAKGSLLGKDIESMSKEEISKAIDEGINVFARASAFHKLKILEVLKEKGYRIAMTGDGVNDSLALKKADVGIAMGVKGTEIAKEASDIVLLDDNFATIKNAVEEGRRVYDNIKKFILFLFGTNIAEIFIVLVSSLFLPFILLYPIQLLWINLVTDGPPALALSFEPAEPNIMKRKPRKQSELMDRKMVLKILSLGISLGFSVFLLSLLTNSSEENVRTVVFTAFVILEIIMIAAIKLNDKTFGLKYWLKNKFLLASFILIIVLQLALVNSPIAPLFKSTPLTIYDLDVLALGIILCFSLSVLGMKIIDKFLAS